LLDDGLAVYRDVSCKFYGMGKAPGVG